MNEKEIVQQGIGKLDDLIKTLTPTTYKGEVKSLWYLREFLKSELPYINTHTDEALNATN